MPKLGWKGPEQPDTRDLKFGAAAAKPPLSCDLRPYCPPVEDQGDLGSCTANAGVSLYEYLENRHKKTFVDLSRLDLYYDTRVLVEGVNPDDDSGAYIRDTVKAMKNYGVGNEKLWPYDVSMFHVKPPAECDADGLLRQILKYERVSQTEAAIKNCIGVLKLPIIFGFMVPYSFFDVGKRGAWYPGKDEEIAGGHAQVVVGYTKTRIICRNSWGTGWGNKGYSTWPWWFILDPNYCSDFWTVYAAEQA
jgi:C1A family cysteine protease